MQRGWLGLALALAVASPAAALAAPPPQTTTHGVHWSFESRGRLGLALESINGELRRHFGAPADRGLLVAHVEPGTPAAAAGVAVGDIITDVDTAAANDVTDVVAAVATAKSGDHVTIAIVRDGKPLQLTATMTDDPMPPRADAPTDPQQLDDMRREMERTIHDMLHDMPWFKSSPDGVRT